MAGEAVIPQRIAITATLSLGADEIAFSFVRSSGPGGQNVNKVATAAQLRFDLLGSPSLPDGVKHRAARLAGSRLTTGGEIVITASRHRTQQLNRAEALARLVELLARAAAVPKHRRPTRPTLASRQRRLAAKARHGATKRLRGAWRGNE